MIPEVPEIDNKCPGTAMKLPALRVLFTPMGRTGTKRPSGTGARAGRRRPPSCLLIAVDAIQNRALVVVTGECSASSLLFWPQVPSQAFRKKHPSTTPSPCARGKLKGSSSASDRPKRSLYTKPF
jgi:hypothetical protein